LPVPFSVPPLRFRVAAFSAPLVVRVPAPLSVRLPAREEVVLGSLSVIEPPLITRLLLAVEFSPLMTSLPVAWLTVTPLTRLSCTISLRLGNPPPVQLAASSQFVVPAPPFQQMPMQNTPDWLSR